MPWKFFTRRSRFSDLNKRIIASVVVLTATAFLIGFATNPYVSVLVALAICALTAVGVWEYGRLIISKGFSPSVPLMVSVAVCLVLAFYVSHRWVVTIPQLPVFVFALGLGFFFLNRFRRAEEALVHVAVEFFGVAYVAIPLSYMIAILYPLSPALNHDGRWWLVYLILVTKITDIGAYFFGRLIGRHRLAPVLSPKKTIEGAIAGFVCAVCLSLGMVWIAREFAGDSFPLRQFDALWLGILIGIFGQIGDLAESLLKRDAVVKDSNDLPGLGGVLDMIDSLIFTAPIVYFYLVWFSP